MTPKTSNRREFLGIAVQSVGLACASGLGMAVAGRNAAARGWAPRPPGAAEGFASMCVKCGLCVAACPKGTLRLAKAGDPVPAGTPFFKPREIPCYMCEDIPCVKVCPSGALDRKLEDIGKARMGIAVVDPNACLSWQGLRCEVCYRDCPAKDKALKLAPHPRQSSYHAVFVPQIDPDHCTGCGLCTWSCPTEKPSVNIIRREDFVGKIGEHYRLGWRKLEDQPHHPHEIRVQKLDKDAAAKSADFLNSMEDPFK